MRPNAKVYSIRLYSEKLTDAEVAANAEVDKERFKSSTVMASAFYPTKAAAFTIVVR